MGSFTFHAKLIKLIGMYYFEYAFKNVVDSIIENHNEQKSSLKESENGCENFNSDFLSTPILMTLGE